MLNQSRPILRARDLIQHIDNLDLYLYGLEQLSEIDNRKVIIATIKFIKQTGRFLSPPLPLFPDLLFPSSNLIVMVIFIITNTSFFSRLVFHLIVITGF